MLQTGTHVASGFYSIIYQVDSNFTIFKFLIYIISVTAWYVDRVKNNLLFVQFLHATVVLMFAFHFSCLQWPAPIPGMAFNTPPRRCCTASITSPSISSLATIAGVFYFVRNYSEEDVHVFTHPGYRYKITGNILCAPMMTAHLIGATLAKRITILCR